MRLSLVMSRLVILASLSPVLLGFWPECLLVLLGDASVDCDSLVGDAEFSDETVSSPM